MRFRRSWWFSPDRQFTSVSIIRVASASSFGYLEIRSPSHPERKRMHHTSSRRDFLKAAGIAPTLLLAAQSAREAAAGPTDDSKLPQVAFGKHRLSRLVCGANPFN